ncbi:hypothetical protein HU200_014196 [Digitaria exilis]|uniref:FBD domain-containing protein n=1 Tax=Digitaria exilis TaxID=1010633 RepID=A0A835KN48_9POAL|nr:hypothetical protein HU200_014196 [Digitaria exilis]
MAMAAGVACDYCREDQLEMECCRGGLLPRSTGLLPDDGAEEEVDRISAMPDDLLLQILAGLGCARAAAHTGLLARRWRGLWARLPRLTFHCVVPGLLGAALAMVAGDPTPPSLIDIHFSDHHMIEPARITSLLAAAAALAPEEFVFHIGGGIPPGPVMLPCFDRTTSIKLDLTYAHFTLPSAGGFPALESLHLENCHMDINDMLRRCPRLRKLRVLDWNSESVVVALTALEELAVRATVQIRRINIVAPALKKLYLDAHCGIHKEFSLSFSAPAVEDFIWKSESRAKRDATTFEQEVHRFQVTDFSILELDLKQGGHVYGTIVLHLLGLCTSIQRLKVTLDDYEKRERCSEDCRCDQTNNWRSQNISLTDLKEVEIQRFRGEDHEVDLLKVLLRCATVLERVTLRFSKKFSPSDSGRLEIDSILKAYPFVTCNIYQ